MYDASVEAIFFDTPLEVCKERNRRRERVVPEWAMDALSARLVPPSADEGFAAVSVERYDAKP
jgi:predicted kinase